MNIIPETKKSIKIGIIVALITMILFVYFIQPILSICGKLFINVFSKVFSAYTDNVFRQAATISPEKPAFTLLTFILSLYAGIIVGFYVAIMVRYISVIRKKEKPKPKPQTKKNLMNQITREKKKIRNHLILMGISLILVLSLITGVYWGQWFRIKITTGFIQHMYVLAPYLSEDEEELYWSQWAQMRSKTDYENIYHKLNKIAEENNIKLPKNYVYSFKDF